MKINIFSAIKVAKKKNHRDSTKSYKLLYDNI